MKVPWCLILARYRTAFFPDHQIQLKVCGIVSISLIIVSVYKLEKFKNSVKVSGGSFRLVPRHPKVPKVGPPR